MRTLPTTRGRNLVMTFPAFNRVVNWRVALQRDPRFSPLEPYATLHGNGDFQTWLRILREIIRDYPAGPNGITRVIVRDAHTWDLEWEGVTRWRDRGWSDPCLGSGHEPRNVRSRRRGPGSSAALPGGPQSCWHLEFRLEDCFSDFWPPALQNGNICIALSPWICDNLL